MGQIQVISGVERRRRWSDEQKRAIVAAAFAPGAVVADVARRADINSGQIYRWRRDLQAEPSGFSEVVVSSGAGPSDRSASMIDVALSDGSRVQIAAVTPPELATAVIKALVRR
jgi:transposase